MNINQVAVIGAGTMGAGIASVISLHNEVVLIDVSAEQLQKATANVEKTLAKWVEKGLIAKESSITALARMSTSTTLEPVAKVDMVIEAVPEVMDIKKSLFSKLAPFVRKDTIVATNTSGLNISEMAVLLDNPSRVLGLHFFNPVPVMKLVEVIRANTTNETVFKTAYEWLQKIGKEPVEVSEYPGFVVNRILIPMLNEAAWTLADGVASAADIDKAMKLGANHPIGPLALADMIGIDVCLAIIENLQAKLPAGKKYEPAPALIELAANKKLGRKTGEGFFKY
ncbi:MAG: 3-hydroxyacyl-CoA dehydrogenase NAD-binding domain-containing protein [Methylococcales bacterium]|nr:3-hydroxyacyl-CoA dehydrogenase NAD-binding domain-containing protein [Methylococcales bacterium]